ncbi:MAG: hypothetical protein C4534_11245 [Gaiellales bacterium]|nr:MAG: hypothetical protein C4534_11245 [Gaiellales bacterium]
MNVFCNRESCKFQLNQLCRTSAISVENGRCATYEPLAAGRPKSGSAVFWGHLEATPAEDDQDR